MYGESCGRIGEGSNSTVLIYKRDAKVYAVKRFRKRRRSESAKDYMKRIAGEYCIASSVSSHPNIVTTLDLVLKEDVYCTVMEYCNGGDLFECIKDGRMNSEYERACCFRQLIRGLSHLHSLGVAHRDVKPENLLWTARGQLKIADFGSATVFRTPYDNTSVLPWEQNVHKVGSVPYIAPELLLTGKRTVDSGTYSAVNITRLDAADIWSAGIVLYCVYRNGLPWKQASPSDAGYREFLKCQGNFVLFTDIPSGPQGLLYRMLDINVQSRISADDILATDGWCKSTMVCRDGIDLANRMHYHSAMQ
ncbi:kinase-like domain-containing protein [Zychaea mexicana]|uniref:kinase-like domain-containing protein n=1 Tax=Zychaea mexicana TaxID=64656 RepID=UPI0022FEFCDA|nr:kinase-like domain-containing protein [Zychaea mexicana]KAI9496642.1 kinase-like domain-containing protein [Zychaea mexicana]